MLKFIYTANQAMLSALKANSFKCSATGYNRVTFAWMSRHFNFVSGNKMADQLVKQEARRYLSRPSTIET